jgi:hypothetical protein
MFFSATEETLEILNSLDVILRVPYKRAMKWNDLHLSPRVESITDDNVESNSRSVSVSTDNLRVVSSDENKTPNMTLKNTLKDLHIS